MRMQSKDYSYGKYTSLGCQTRSEIRKININDHKYSCLCLRRRKANIKETDPSLCLQADPKLMFRN